ncbi:glycerol-3-phosphate 1-O-acyltransferase PlsB [Cognatiluteimonas weifangensis]|uniref:Glycerol-3-phosphate acyltransferase n=1 Tax=Cognatiluteimonas weifangensis TaxID=2303539 RepID=A0A372DHK2_9GAMM|nr:glycerol-3-phosphate 1-O-acyltransferase PlsB [Luteimonas weifangensis]RFP59009.1 glycerol-3-phosphate 1-O-acyltransferase PlsB [Luteimonas weifangensis]
MAAMPTQPTLPFQPPEDPPPTPEPSPAAVGPTTPEPAAAAGDSGAGETDASGRGAVAERVPEQAELPMAADPRDRPWHRAAPRARQPWWARGLGKLLEPWIGLKVEPTGGPQVDARPLCYVLEDYGLSNALILDRACREAGLPSPLRPLPGDPLGRKRAYVALSRRSAGSALGRAASLATNKPLRPVKTHSGSLARLLQAHRADPALDVQLVPVSIFVGRAPDKQSGWFSVLFSENWTLVGRFRRLLAILLNGRDTLVQFAPAVDLRAIVAEGLDPERTVRKLSRVLRTHFHRIREAVIGPDLSTRRLLIDKVLSAETVKEAIADQARRDGRSGKGDADAWKKAHAYAYEIAADYSHPVVRSVSFLLTSVWNRIYRGVLVHHLDKLKAAAPGHEIVYVPCHRSHMDYLLLSYLLYTRGIVPPHIVAGINLNLPVLGTLLRKGGAFFIRRSIRGSALYSAVLGEYVAQLVAGGYSLEYFIEGGRSRTGRLLQPKGGMLSMTIRAFLRQPTRPVLFQPVYIGYEKLMEGASYLDELSGKPKEAESIWALLWGIPRVLRQNYGQVVVNFGEPVALAEQLAAYAPQWDGSALDDDDRPDWLSATVDATAQRIQVEINRAADVNPVNLLAMALLSTPKHAMGEADLLAQIALSKTLLAEVPYGERVTVTPHTPAQILAHGEEIGMLTRTPHPLGDVLGVDGDTAVLLSYFRNNVLHLFTASGWIACCFQHNRRMPRQAVLQLGRTMYPFLKAELFLPWTEEEFAQRLDRTIEVFVREGLLQVVDSGGEDDGGILARNAGQSDEVFRLRAIGHALQQAFERYYIAISVLSKNGPGTLGAAELESLCQLAAQRLSLLYAPAAPEFFDKSLFRGFILKLRELKLVWPDEHNKLVFDQRLDAWARDAKVILGRELRHTIEKVSPEAAKPDEATPAD